jgi:hypothetical protein
MYTETFHVAAAQTASRPQSSTWQAALLALDGLLTFIATVRLYKPAKAAMERRKARKAA